MRGWLVAVVRRPTSWTAAAAVVGGALGGVATLYCLSAPETLWAGWCTIDFILNSLQASILLTSTSLVGICVLLRDKSRLLALCSGTLAGLLSLITLFWIATGGAPGLPPLLEYVPYGFGSSQYATIATFLGRPVLLIFFAAALMWTGRWLFASLPLLLAVLESLSLVISPVSLARSLGDAEWLLLLFGVPGTGTGLAEDAIWVLLGMEIFRSGQRLEREKLEKKRQRVAGENSRKARRIYEEAFGAGDLSVVGELVAEDFFDHRHDRRGREEFRRTIGGLRRTFPDLSVRVEEQTAEGDTVTTRCTLSGTDRGGVLWYPPTRRHATFTGTYVDRFSDGMLVEHDEETDMARLLMQLGLPVAEGG